MPSASAASIYRLLVRHGYNNNNLRLPRYTHNFASVIQPKSWSCRTIKTHASCYSASQDIIKSNEDTTQTTNKLMYVGQLNNRIMYLKGVSILSSATLAGAYGYAISHKGLSVALTITGFAFSPFLLSPFVIAWFFKRYITYLYYDKSEGIYTAHHYGLLVNTKSCSFKKQDVERTDVSGILSNFKVGRKPFFLHDEDLIDIESVQLYKEMVGLDKVEPQEEDNSNEKTSL